MVGRLRSKAKFIPWVGIVADFDSHYGSQNFPTIALRPVGVPLSGTVNASFTENNFLFGPRVSVSVGKFRPFAEALFGGAHVNANNGVGSDTSFATALGGGLDYKIIRSVAGGFRETTCRRVSSGPRRTMCGCRPVSCCAFENRSETVLHDHAKAGSSWLAAILFLWQRENA